MSDTGPLRPDRDGLQSCLDSTLESTRVFWRTKHGYERFARDPRPIRECLAQEESDQLTQALTVG